MSPAKPFNDSVERSHEEYKEYKHLKVSSCDLNPWLVKRWLTASLNRDIALKSLVPLHFLLFCVIHIAWTELSKCKVVNSWFILNYKYPSIGEIENFYTGTWLLKHSRKHLFLFQRFYGGHRWPLKKLHGESTTVALNIMFC